MRRRAGEHLHGAARQAADRGRVPAAGDVADRSEDPGRSEPAHLDVGREPDAQLLRVAARAPLGLLGPHGIEVELLERAVERRVVVAAVDREPGRDRRRELGDEVEPPQLDRIHLELDRERVDGPFDRVRRLRPSRTAVGIGRRRVREDAGARQAVGGDVVAAAVDPGAEQRDPGRHELQVGAHRGDEPHADGGDLPLRGRGELDLLEDVAAVDGRVESLRALLDPLDRLLEPAGEREAERFLGVDVELRAEAAADVGRDHPQPRLGNPDHAAKA